MNFLFLLLGLPFPTTHAVTLIRNQPVWPAHFAAGTNGSFYVLDYQDQRITLFDANLNEVKTFGAGGPGPGEFLLPEDIFFADGKLYVQDDASFTVFTADGQPLEKIKKPFPGQWWATGKSWIARKRSFENGQDDLIWFSLDFKETKVLHQDRDQSFDGHNRYLGKKPIPPALSKDHRWLARVEKGQYLIHIFDTHSGDKRTTVAGEMKRLPYTEERAEKATKLAQAAMTAVHPEKDPSSVKIIHPRFFNPIVRLVFTGNNHLHLFEPLGPGKAKATHAVDLDGKRMPTIAAPDRHYYKVLMMDDTHALVATYEDEEAGIARVKKADLAEALQQLQ